MKPAYLDTQVAVWLAHAEGKRISRRAASAIDKYELLISGMVHLELAYMYEIGRSKHTPDQILEELRERGDVRICRLSLDAVASAARRESWTRDVFDRMIVANARCSGDAYLISADAKIGKHYPHVIW